MNHTLVGGRESGIGRKIMNGVLEKPTNLYHQNNALDLRHLSDNGWTWKLIGIGIWIVFRRSSERIGILFRSLNRSPIEIPIKGIIYGNGDDGAEFVAIIKRVRIMKSNVFILLGGLLGFWLVPICEPIIRLVPKPSVPTNLLIELEYGNIGIDTVVFPV